MPTFADHLIVAVLFVVAPWHGRRTYRQLQERVAKGDLDYRASEYRWTIALEWGAVALVLVLWWLNGRTAEALGLTVPAGGASLAGLVLTAIGLMWLGLQWRAIVRLSGDGLASLRAQLEGARALLPTTDREAVWFRALAVTAGICEEIVYRGYLIWYLSVYLPGWVAVVVAGVGFGVAHYYQGASGVVKTGVTGLVAGFLYYGTGSLLWPMVLHAAIDLQGGAVGRRLLGAPLVTPDPTDR